MESDKNIEIRYRLWKERVIIGALYLISSVFIIWLGWGGDFLRNLILQQMGRKALFCVAVAFLGLSLRAFYRIQFGIPDAANKLPAHLFLGYMIAYPIILFAVTPIIVAISNLYDGDAFYLTAFSISFLAGFYIERVSDLGNRT